MCVFKVDGCNLHSCLTEIILGKFPNAIIWSLLMTRSADSLSTVSMGPIPMASNLQTSVIRWGATSLSTWASRWSWMRWLNIHPRQLSKSQSSLGFTTSHTLREHRCTCTATLFAEVWRNWEQFHWLRNFTVLTQVGLGFMDKFLHPNSCPIWYEKDPLWTHLSRSRRMIAKFSRKLKSYFRLGGNTS